MVGLAILFFFALYLGVSVGVVWATVRWAKRRGRGSWKWGISAAFVMYLLVFWDHVPTWLAHEYYCDNYAGLTVYKTPEQWKAENPSVAEQLRWKKKPQYERVERGVVYHLNERIDWIIAGRPLPVGFVGVQEEIILDRETQEVLLREVDITSGVGNFLVSANDWRDYKFWLGAFNSCQGSIEREKWLHENRNFRLYMNQFAEFGKGEQE